MAVTLDVSGIAVDVIRKNIKNVHLSVHPPTGRVRIAAPLRMSLDTVRLFAISKLGWIRHQQRTLLRQERETEREYLDRESHYLWGKRLLLKVVEFDAAPEVRVRHGSIVLQVRPGADVGTRGGVLGAWHRQLLKGEGVELVEAWEPRLKVTVAGLFVQQMKTKWGSCNPSARTIRLNTELAKKPKECLEYIVVHEMAHLLEPTHGPQFVGVMDRVLPSWRELREVLNSLPIGHQRWSY